MSSKNGAGPVFRECFRLPVLEPGPRRFFVSDDEVWLPHDDDASCSSGDRSFDINCSFRRYRRASLWEQTFGRFKTEVTVFRAVELWAVDAGWSAALKNQTEPRVERVTQCSRNARLGLWSHLFDLKHTVLCLEMSNGAVVLVDKNTSEVITPRPITPTCCGVQKRRTHTL